MIQEVKGQGHSGPWPILARCAHAHQQTTWCSSWESVVQIAGDEALSFSIPGATVFRASLVSPVVVTAPNNGSNDVEQQVLDMVKGAIERHLTPLVEQLSPLVTQFQTQRESGGGESNTFLPFGDDELLPSAPLQLYANFNTPPVGRMSPSGARQ